MKAETSAVVMTPAITAIRMSLARLSFGHIKTDSQQCPFICTLFFTANELLENAQQRYRLQMPKRFNINPQPEEGIIITKIDAAKRQLETAITLWFHDDDPVSIHTLASAAQEILHPLAKKAGTFEGTLDTIYAADGHEDEWLASIRFYHNFFKHGAKDADASIKLNPEVNTYLIRTVIQVYQKFTGTTTPVMNAYIVRFIFSHPHVHDGDPYPHIPSEVKDKLNEAPKDMFLEVFLKASAGMP